VLRAELQRIQAELDNAQAGFDLDEWAGQVPVDTPVTRPALAATLTTAPALRACFRPHAGLENAFWLRRDEREVAVTFDPATFDAHPSTLQLLTFGNPLLESLLEQVPALGGDGEWIAGRVKRLEVGTPPFAR